ncbi:MAG: hypothetical protein ACO1NY_08375 [Pseudorhodoplanes sp.]
MRAFFAYAVALPIAGGIVTCVATYVGWAAIAALIWQPFWRTMRDFGMHYDDIAASFLLVLGPPYVGLIFILTTITSLIVFLFVHKSKYCSLLFTLPNLIPAIMVFLTFYVGPYGGIFADHIWRFPLAEIIVLLIGIGWSIVSLKVLRRAGNAES